MSAEPRPRFFFREAIAQALREEMQNDARVILVGQDIGRMGGAYGEFTGLLAEFGPERVRDAPVAEAAMVGLAVGAAAAGMKPLVSITYMDFLMLALDPLVNYAAKLRFKTQGQISAPFVVKVTAGAKGQGVAHSQCIESWLMGVPGLTVVAPASAGDAYGLLKSAFRQDGPAVFVDHKRLFPMAGELAAEWIGLPQARVVSSGSDVTIVAHSYMVKIAQTAATSLAAEGVSAEVIDLRSLAPLDVPTISASVAKTGVLVTVEEGQLACGVGSEVAFQIRERIGNVAVARVGALPAPVSSNSRIESATIPDAGRVVQTVRRLLAGRTREP